MFLERCHRMLAKGNFHRIYIKRPASFTKFHTIKYDWEHWMKYLPPIDYRRKKWCPHWCSRAMNTWLNAVGKVRWCLAERSSIQRSLTTAVAAHSIYIRKSCESWLAVAGGRLSQMNISFSLQFYKSFWIDGRTECCIETVDREGHHILSIFERTQGADTRFASLCVGCDRRKGVTSQEWINHPNLWNGNDLWRFSAWVVSGASELSIQTRTEIEVISELSLRNEYFWRN